MAGFVNQNFNVFILFKSSGRSISIRQSHSIIFRKASKVRVFSTGSIFTVEARESKTKCVRINLSYWTVLFVGQRNNTISHHRRFNVIFSLMNPPQAKPMLRERDRERERELNQEVLERDWDRERETTPTLITLLSPLIPLTPATAQTPPQNIYTTIAILINNTPIKANGPESNLK